MPSDDRDTSRDSERRLKHQTSASSDYGRAIIPMWDSSDPDRAPPPLPLNPSSPSVTSRPNTTSAIQSAHAALAEKARESAFPTSTPPKRVDGSPERSLIKGAAHNRMQSLQPGHVRDLSSFLEGGSIPPSPSRSSDNSGHRPLTPLTVREVSSDAKSPEKRRSRSTTPTRTGRETPTIRPSLRRPPQSILGENTPPQSATMLALQNMPAREVDSPLANVTNGSTAMVRAPQTFDAISTQILTLTSIATALQREMAQLSRRSKDNATDLVSLKEATNARDEDIRRSLRELASNLSEASSRSSSNMSHGGGLLIESRPHATGSRAIKTVTLPRIPSPTSFARSMDRESLMGSPTPYHTDGATSIALIEKILREMGTKEGQDLLVARLTDIADRLARDGMATAKKMDELLQFVKGNSESRAVIPAHSGGGIGGNGTGRPRNLSFGEAPRLQLDFDYPRAGSMVSRVENLLSMNKENMNRSGPTRAAEMINEDILKVIHTVKDGVAHGGGLTAEVKALVRDLRAEVLGMGREIGRKLDEHIRKDTNSPSKAAPADKDFVARVIEDGLEELKQHMDIVTREARRQSGASVASRSAVDSREVYNAVRSAMTDMQAAQQTSRSPPDSGLQREDIIDAVKEAWENYKPEIEVQQFGLEREELLACLKEGIQEFAPDTTRGIGGATRDEVFKAVVEGLKHFSPPRVETHASLTRDDILDTFRECLEDCGFPTAQSMTSRNANSTRGDVLDAVREGLSTFEFPRHVAGPTSRDVGTTAHISDRLQEIVASMRAEFKAVSDEAKQNVAAHGRDTEQVLDATKDGHEKLRSDMEAYIERAVDIGGKDEILQEMDDNFNRLRIDFEGLLSKGSESSLASVKMELELLRESIDNSIVPGAGGVDREDITRAFKDGLESLRADLDRPRGSNESVLSGTGEILDALHDGLTGLRAEVEKIGSKPVDMTVHHEILDTLRTGLESVRVDMDRMRESSHSERDVASVTNGAVITAESLNRNDIENLEVLITQLRIKVEALESMPPPPPQAVPGMLLREDLVTLEETLRNVQDSVAGMSGRDRSVDEDSVRREDVEAIETLLRNTKAKMDDIDPEQAVKRDHLDAVEEIIRETREAIDELASRVGETPKRQDIHLIESLIKEVVLGLEDIKERAEKDADDVEKVRRTDVEAVESACLDLKVQIEQMILTDISVLASKDDVTNIGKMVKEFKERVESHADTTAQAFEERQAETVGVGERVSEIKSFLAEFKDAIKERLDEGATGIDALGKLLESLGDTISENASITDDMKSLFDTVKSEFEKSNAGVVGVKLDSDEKFQKTWDMIDEQFSSVMRKYEEAQAAAETKARDGDEVQARMELAMLTTKSVAEELKILIDTLGTTMTDSVDKMDEASKTLYNRVEETFTRVEETHADAKAEHQLTREQVFKTMTAVEGVHDQVADYHPKILDSIKDVLLIVGQHYEHSKTSTDALPEKIAEKAVPVSQFDQPMLKEAEKYDDGQIHEKLDKLADQMHTAGKSFAQLEMLDKIHQQVMQTATEVSDFVAAQTLRISNEHEDKEKSVESATLALEKILAQKEHLESEVGDLRGEKDQLRNTISILKAEQDGLANQKMRLSADVSSLETALRIRREELHAMEARAEGLERRILEGVLDHSRAFLISKPTKDRDAMNLKRVPSQNASTTGSVTSAATARSRVSHTTQTAVDMAMSGTRGLKIHPTKDPAGPSKRIFSLNQITNNVPTGGFKRSHSVKQPGSSSALRKSSWGGSLRRNYGELNKENLALKESEEESEEGDNVSEAGTMRKLSRGTVVTGTDVTESIDEGTEYDETEGEYSESEVSARYDGGVVVFDEEAAVS